MPRDTIINDEHYICNFCPNVKRLLDGVCDECREFIDLEAKLKTIEAIMDKFSKAEINEMFFGYFPKAEIEQRNGGDYYGDTNVDEPIFFDGVKAMNYIGSHCCVGDWMMRKLITETLAGRFKI